MLMLVLSTLDVVVCSVFCVEFELFLLTLKLIVHDCTHRVVIIAIIAVEIARIISTHWLPVIFFVK